MPPVCIDLVSEMKLKLFKLKRNLIFLEILISKQFGAGMDWCTKSIIKTNHLTTPNIYAF